MDDSKISSDGEAELARSSPFRAMADKIDRNPGPDFAGAFVVVPPQGDPASILILDPAASPLIFWSNLQTRADIMVRELKDREERAASMGPKRR